MDKTRKKNIKRVITFLCVVLVVAFLTVMPLSAKQAPEEDGPKASILSDTVSLGSIDTELIGGGTLAEEAAVTVSVPAEVKLTEFLVSNGQAVTEGTPLATVDRVTVMTAIIQVQETLEYLSEEIQDAGTVSTTEKLIAHAGGIVKILYAEAGESVQSVMLEHGALAVLSLDGLMAVDLETESSLSVGTAVTVTLSDGTAVTGKVAKNLAGEMTVTLEDDGYPVDAAVEVTDEEGGAIGSGQLYIYSPWNATAYAGTVDSISVSVGDTLNAGKTLMVLSDVGYSATYRQLISQRQEYEALMQTLFALYQTEIITAPCDGVVSGVDQNSAQLLAASGQGVTLSLLSYTSTGSDNGEFGDTDATLGVTTLSAGLTMDGPPSMGGGGFFPGTGGGYTQTPEEEFEPYTLEVTQIAAITPQNTMTIEIVIDELDIRYLQVGMTAQVKIGALGGEKFTATITEIGNTGTNNGGNSKFTVELTMDRRENLLSGMNVTVTIVLETANDVLTIPADALVEQGNQTVVYTGYDPETDTLLNPVAVKVGCSDGETVEILEGLTNGQTYYYAYYDTLEISYTPNFGGGGGFMFG